MKITLRNSGFQPVLIKSCCCRRCVDVMLYLCWSRTQFRLYFSMCLVAKTSSWLPKNNWHCVFFVIDVLKVRDAYKTYMKKVAKLLGGGPDSDEQMMKVFELERQLAMVSICWFSLE